MVKMVSSSRGEGQRRGSASVGRRRRKRGCLARCMNMSQCVCMGCFEWCMYLLGPVLIVVVLVLVSCESYWVLKYMVPECCGFLWAVHFSIVASLLINGLFNYFMCVTTNPGTHDSILYADLVYEASQDGYIDRSDWESFADHHGHSRERVLPSELSESKHESSNSAAIEKGNGERRRGFSRVVPNGHDAILVKKAQSWMERGPYEWGWCRYTDGPKAPRSHFDYVTKKLVLNMDHYCPWMFNVVGYANYRYFVLFLIYVTLACIYGICLTAAPFSAMIAKSPQARSRRPRSKDARSAVLFTFVLALSVGIAVAFLCSWHIFLVLTAQTTIEFYGNHTLRRRAKAKDMVYHNPYDQGMRKNWAHVFGPGHFLLTILPSRRKPPASPWPSPSAVRRFHQRSSLSIV